MSKKQPQADDLPPGSFVEFGQGELIFGESDTGTEMYIIQRGAVEILRGDGGDGRRIDLLREGDFFGEEAVLEEAPRAVTARASTPCRLLRIARSEFDLTLHARPEVAFHMLRRLSGKVRELTLAEPRRAAAGSAAAATRPVPAGSPRPGASGHRLVHQATGLEFPLTASGQSVVGRAGAGSEAAPDIDLEPTEEVSSISRRHAAIERRNDRFFVIEEVPSTNGSWVNGQPVRPGTPVEIRPGDEVQFGRVKLRFLA